MLAAPPPLPELVGLIVAPRPRKRRVESGANDNRNSAAARFDLEDCRLITATMPVEDQIVAMMGLVGQAHAASVPVTQWRPLLSSFFQVEIWPALRCLHRHFDDNLGAFVAAHPNDLVQTRPACLGLAWRCTLIDTNPPPQTPSQLISAPGRW